MFTEKRQDFKHAFIVILWGLLFLSILLTPYLFNYAFIVKYLDRLLPLYEIIFVLLASKGFYEVSKYSNFNINCINRRLNIRLTPVALLLMLIASSLAYSSLSSFRYASGTHSYHISDEDFKAYLWLKDYVNSRGHDNFVIIVITTNLQYAEIRRLLFHSLLIDKSYSYYEASTISAAEYIIQQSLEEEGGKYVVLSSKLPKDMIDVLLNFLSTNSFRLIYEQEAKIFYGSI
jgi:hypothetical protein